MISATEIGLRFYAGRKIMYVIFALLLLATCLLISGCGVTINMTHYYTVNGNENRISGTVRTDSRPDITTNTTATADIPVSALP